MILTYKDIVRQYVYQLSLVFAARGAEELHGAINELREFGTEVNEAMFYVDGGYGEVEQRVREGGILKIIHKRLMFIIDCSFEHNVVQFDRALSVMKMDLDKYSMDIQDSCL